LSKSIQEEITLESSEIEATISGLEVFIVEPEVGVGETKVIDGYLEFAVFSFALKGIICHPSWQLQL
jgi:hypothetical protein